MLPYRSRASSNVDRLPRKDIGPVQKQHEVVRPRFEKDLVQPFLRFPDVLADYTEAIDLVTVELLFIRYDPSSHGLVGEDIGSKTTY